MQQGSQTCPEDIKSLILKLVSDLKVSKKLHLAASIEANWQKTAMDYSKELNEWVPSRPIEPELLSAFEKELGRVGMSAITTPKVLGSLATRRVIQTAPHLGATEIPRMLSINWLGSLGIGPEDFYVVGMFSGIPFSNNFRPGRINMKNSSINLFPSALQDAMIYRSLIPQKLTDSLKELPVKLKILLPEAKPGDSYTKWALNACQNIERKILNKENLVYIDINEVISEYLVQALDKKDHVIYKIFFNPEIKNAFYKVFPSETIFYRPTTDGKYEKMENVTLSEIVSREKLIEELIKGRLCPGLLLQFLVLVFLNEFKCFGSFRQVEYLPEYQQKLRTLSFLKEYNIANVPTMNLTTGSLENNPYPVDIILGEKFFPGEDMLFGELLINMKDTLLDK